MYDALLQLLEAVATHQFSLLHENLRYTIIAVSIIVNKFVIQII